MKTVAVLYARKDSIYRDIPGCDVWDEERDARKFSGNMPIVAHPPCRAWAGMAHLARPRADEKDLARHAVAMIRENGGVLEHPATSKLWRDQSLPEPGERDAWGGFTVVLPQWWFGHLAEKPTRFYIVGCNPKTLPEIPIQLGDAPCVVTTSKRKCKTPPEEWRPRLTAKQREATPIKLATWLVAVARSAKVDAFAPIS